MQFQTTHLWRRAFGDEAPKGHAVARNRLASAYESFWRHGTLLAAQIAHDLPNLTLHDERHFEALWQRADMIAGPDYPLNPLELFVFGGAILLHDAGHTVSAFSEGLAELRNTPQWQDSVVTVLRSENPDGQLPDHGPDLPAEIQQRVLFNTLRVLHAERAESLAGMSFTNRETGQRFDLIEDAHLREHLGETIGRIASSHHWDLDDLEMRLRPRLGGLAEFPPEWMLEPIKLACLLRCADAVQIDQTRTPDFSYALLRLKGLSEAHWRGQNRLATPILSAAAPEALLFTSTKPFGISDADAWWIAHDAISLANHELQSCARLLKDLKLQPFAVTRIQDADSAKRLSTHVEVREWQPVVAEVKVSGVEQLVALFGGEQLYGRDLAVPVRELVQNADDAIRARRGLEESAEYTGRITVRINADTDNGREGYWLHVEDNGIGMSERRLTETLLEFGTSYWSSDLIRTEFPGLLAKRLRQTGRYGIGFFSVLMATDRIVVASRNYKEGSSAVRSLNFREGLKLRPVLLEGADPPLPMDVCTRVSMFMLPEKLTALLRVRCDVRAEPQEVNLAQLVSHLCPSLDSEVRVQQDGKELTPVHRSDWYEHDLIGWLNRITLSQVCGDNIPAEYTKAGVRRLRPIVSGDRRLGLATIATWPIRGGVHTIGGLVAGHHSKMASSFSEEFLGVIEVQPEGPRRFGGRLSASPEQVSMWASEQAVLLTTEKLGKGQLYYAAAMVAQFEGDPTPIAMFPLNRKMVTLQAVFARLRKTDIVAPVWVHYPDRLTLSSVMLQTSAATHVGLPNDEIKLGTAVLEAQRVQGQLGTEGAYYRVPTNEHPAANSFLGCLRRYCEKEGVELVIEREENILFGQYIGPSSERENIRNEMELRSHGIRLHLRK